jgi:hypothetical protein
MDPLTDEQRERLTRPAIASLEHIGRAWGIDDGAVAALVGIGIETYVAHRRGENPGPLPQEALYAGSALTAIDRMLEAQDVPVWQWIKQARAEPPFDGRTPLEAMSGGTDAVVEVWRSLRDAAAPSGNPAP